jgi:hypothetical protein
MKGRKMRIEKEDPILGLGFIFAFHDGVDTL